MTGGDGCGIGVVVEPPVTTGGAGVGVLTGGSDDGGKEVGIGVGGVKRALTRAVNCWFVVLPPTSCPKS